MFLLTRNYLNERQFCAVTTSVARAVIAARRFLALEDRQFCSYEILDVQINWSEDWAMRSMTRYEGPLQRRPILVVRKADYEANVLTLFFPHKSLTVTHKFAEPLNQITVN